MSRKERTKAAAAASSQTFSEARCFVISAGAEYKRRERATHAAVVLHDGGDQAGGGGGHPCAVWAPAARELFKRCVLHDAGLASTCLHRSGGVTACAARVTAPALVPKKPTDALLFLCSGAARALYILDAGDFWGELITEWSTPSLGKVAKPLARLWAKLNPQGAHVAALGVDTTHLLLKLLPGTSCNSRS
jgi:hypothetical protein